MIPLQLTVKNFMCYRSGVPTLDLESIHVACICGDNGHGKTALLDAITWVLWGHARSRTQEELVAQGETSMSVELDFFAREQRYRVSRRHSRSARGKQGTTVLELQVVTDDGVRPITGNTMRDTQARIIELLHMDYDTFVNTAFLRQGDADRFTTSTPAQRKETLAEVLDLSYYGQLEERARAYSRQNQEQLTGIDADIDVRRRDIDERPQREEQLASINVALAGLIPESDTKRGQVEELRRSVDALRGRQQELQELAQRVVDQQRDVAQLESQVGTHQGRVADYENVLSHSATREADRVQVRIGTARSGAGGQEQPRWRKGSTGTGDRRTT